MLRKVNGLLANLPYFGMIRALVYDTCIAFSITIHTVPGTGSGGGMTRNR